MPRVPVRLFPLPEVEPFAAPVIADGRVRFVGEPVAVVLAASAAIAEDACEKIVLEIDEHPAVSELASALTGDALVHEMHGSNVIVAYTSIVGDADAAFRMQSIAARKPSTCIVTPRCRWSHARCLPSGTKAVST